MAKLSTNMLTLPDWAKRLDPDGKVAMIVEMLNQRKEVLTDALWKEGNLSTGERTTVRTGLPTVAWRMLNQGVQPSKSTTAQIDEACGMLEAYSEVDKDLAELNGNVGAFRLSEAEAFVEAMNQEFVATFFYGNASVSPEEFTGLAPRYSSTSAGNAENLILAGGSGSDNASIFVVNWGAQGIFGIFPKGSVAGLQHKDLGLQVVQTSATVAGTRMMAYLDHWQWKCGIALKNWQHVVRIANIDTLDTTPKIGIDINDYLLKAVHRIPAMTDAAAIYCNRLVLEYWDKQNRDDVISGGGITYANVNGVLQPSFRGIPIRLCDGLSVYETVVS